MYRLHFSEGKIVKGIEMSVTFIIQHAGKMQCFFDIVTIVLTFHIPELA